MKLFLFLFSIKGILETIFCFFFLNQKGQTSKAFKMKFYWLLHASTHKHFKEESGGALDPPRPPLAPPLDESQVVVSSSGWWSIFISLKGYLVKHFACNFLLMMLGQRILVLLLQVKANNTKKPYFSTKGNTNNFFNCSFLHGWREWFQGSFLHRVAWFFFIPFSSIFVVLKIGEHTK